MDCIEKTNSDCTLDEPMTRPVSPKNLENNSGKVPSEDDTVSANKRLKKSYSSAVWDYIDRDTRTCCCGQVFSEKTSTSSLYNHLRTHSGLFNTCKVEHYGKESVDQLFRESQLSRLICKTNLPITFVDNPEFIQFMKVFDPQFKVPCSQTMKKIISREANILSSNITKTLQAALYFGFTTDLWSQFNSSFLGITVHYLNQHWERKRKCFKILKFNARHTGEEIGKAFSESVKNLPIEKFVFLTSDNASNIIKICQNNFPQVSHYRCFAHTLQLIVKACFEDDEVNKLIRKVAKISSWFKRSTVAKLDLMDIQAQSGAKKSLMPKLAVSTRWNSHYFMIERLLALKQSIIDVITRNGDTPFEEEEDTVIGA